jgi:hypothetical protein
MIDISTRNFRLMCLVSAYAISILYAFTSTMVNAIVWSNSSSSELLSGDVRILFAVSDKSSILVATPSNPVTRVETIYKTRVKATKYT